MVGWGFVVRDRTGIANGRREGVLVKKAELHKSQTAALTARQGLVVLAGRDDFLAFLDIAAACAHAIASLQRLLDDARSHSPCGTGDEHDFVVRRAAARHLARAGQSLGKLRAGLHELSPDIGERILGLSPRCYASRYATLVSGICKGYTGRVGNARLCCCGSPHRCRFDSLRPRSQPPCRTHFTSRGKGTFVSGRASLYCDRRLL